MATSQYPARSLAGHGILITVRVVGTVRLLHSTNIQQAKGFPDIATRRFLSVLHTVRPGLALFALVDYDPHGIAILRTYTVGSKRLDHEQDITVPAMKWLGIRSTDILKNKLCLVGQSSETSDDSSGQELSSQGSVAYSQDSAGLSLQPPHRIHCAHVD